MSSDWRSYCRAKGLEIVGDDRSEVLVTLGDPERRPRMHRVRVRDCSDGTYQFEATVISRDASAYVDLDLWLWRQNRRAQLVGFRVVGQKVIGQGWVPKQGLEKDEFLHVLRRVAAESDRLEFLLTGKDHR